LKCDGCGAEGWFKTVICRDDRDRGGVLCDACWLHLADRLWIVAGPVTVTARCDECDGFMNPRELVAIRGLVKESYRGTCVSCSA